MKTNACFVRVLNAVALLLLFAGAAFFISCPTEPGSGKGIHGSGPVDGVFYAFETLQNGVLLDEYGFNNGRVVNMNASNVIGDGYDGNAFHFNGEGTAPATNLQGGNYIIVNNSALVNPGSITIEFNVKIDTLWPESGQSDFYILGKFRSYAVNLHIDYNNPTPYFWINLNTESRPWGQTAPQSILYVPVTGIDDGCWHRLAVTYDQATGERWAYYDEEPRKTLDDGGTTPSEPLIENREYLTIGGIAYYSPDRLGQPGLWGSIDNLRITNRALSEDELLPFTPQQKPDSAYYKFETLVNGHVKDEMKASSGKAYNMGGSNIIAAGYEGKALHFNGKGTLVAPDYNLQTNDYVVIRDNPVINPESITVQFNVKIDTLWPETKQNQMYILGKYNSYAVNFYIDYTNMIPYLQVGMYTASRPWGQTDPQSLIMVPAVTIADGNWHRVAITYDKASGERWAYYDNNPAITYSNGAVTPGEPLIDNREYLTLGGVAYYAPDRLSPGRTGLWGAIDNLKITNRALSEAELDSFTPGPAITEARYTFDVFDGWNVIDANGSSGGKAYRMTANNNLITGATGTGKALSFNSFLTASSVQNDLGNQGNFAVIRDNPVINPESITVAFHLKVNNTGGPNMSTWDGNNFIVAKYQSYMINLVKNGQTNPPELRVDLMGAPGTGYDWNQRGTSTTRVVMTTEAANIADGNWHKVAATYDKTSGVRKLFFDTASKTGMGVSAGMPLYDNLDYLALGAWATHNHTTTNPSDHWYDTSPDRLDFNGFRGAIDNLVITNTALDDPFSLLPALPEE
jgi:hypothetical protein